MSFITKSIKIVFRPNGFVFPFNIFTQRPTTTTTTTTTTTAATTSASSTTAVTPSPIQQISGGFINGQLSGQASLANGYPSYFPSLIGGVNSGAIVFPGGRPPGGIFGAGGGYYPIGGIATAAGK